MQREDYALSIVGAAIVVIVLLAVTVHATVGWSDVGAAWVQAVGSVLALAIAIAVPLGMHRQESKLRRKEEEATALIVALGMHAIIGPLVGVARAVRESMLAHAPGNDQPNIELSIELFASITYPTEWQILQIERVSRDAAIALARGAAFVAQVERAIGIYRGRPPQPANRAHVASLLPILSVGVTQLERGQTLLIPLLTPAELSTEEAAKLIAAVASDTNT